MEPMTRFQAVVYGIIQGLTEWLPISSTAHIRIFPELVGWQDPGAPFTAVIQLGTLVSAILYFWLDIVRISLATFRGLAKGKPFAEQDARLGWMIALGTVPVVVLGLRFHKQIEQDWRSLYIICGSLSIFALILGLADFLAYRRTLAQAKQKDMSQLGVLDVFLVGVAQAFALIPGASRSGVTITGGLLVGMNRATATRFSFLLSLPAVFGAAIYQLYKMYLSSEELHEARPDEVNLILATVISGFVGYASIAFMVTYLKSHSTYIFIIYRLILASVLLVLLWKGVIQPLAS
jgi:undecaprenyl-diphosphatase